MGCTIVAASAQSNGAHYLFVGHVGGLVVVSCNLYVQVAQAHLVARCIVTILHFGEFGLLLAVFGVVPWGLVANHTLAGMVVSLKVDVN